MQSEVVNTLDSEISKHLHHEVAACCLWLRGEDSMVVRDASFLDRLESLYTSWSSDTSLRKVWMLNQGLLDSSVQFVKSIQRRDLM